MTNTFFRLFRLLTRKQRREFFILQMLMLLSSVADLVGTASIMPFVALAADPSVLQSNPYLATTYDAMGQPPQGEFLLMVGGVFIGLIILANGTMMVSQFLMNRYASRVGGEISTRLYGHFLSRDLVFHAETNSAFMIQAIMRDSLTLSTMLVAPALRINFWFFSIFLLAALIVYVDPFVAFSTVVVLVLFYWMVFYLVRRTIHKNGLLISRLGQRRNQVLNESFGGIRDVKLYSYEAGYLRRFQRDTRRSARALADNNILAESPYFLIEMIVLAGMVLITLYLYRQGDGLHAALPVLTLYGLAGLKIVPKVQQSYAALTKIRSAQPVFKRLYEHLAAYSEKTHFLVDVPRIMTPQSAVTIDGVTYRYNSESSPVFDRLSALFPAGEITAITGKSGAGKTTLLEILMGLLSPEEGQIAVDGHPLSEQEMPNWRASIAYVPQEVYLTDSSLAQNIAFGEDRDDIDLERVSWAAKAACIDELAGGSEEGLWVLIGERGSLLSGGQRQRIGIARALYKNVPLLFLDEATSALDDATQAQVMQNLRELTPKITVIMNTHQRNTLAIADSVVELS